MRQAEIGKLTGECLLRREGERKDQSGAQPAPRRVAADRIAEHDRPGVLVRRDAVHETQQERLHQDGAGRAGPGTETGIEKRAHAAQAEVMPLVIPPIVLLVMSPGAVSVARHVRHSPFRIRWWSRTAIPVSRSSAAKSPAPIRQGTGTS